MSSFNYCNTIWHFCNDGDILKLEKLQKRALRIIFNDYESNYDTLLQRSGRPLLYVSRLRAVALETYKTINKQNPQFLQDLFVPKENHYGLRNGSQMIQPKVRTEKIWPKLSPIPRFKAMELLATRYETCCLWKHLQKIIVEIVWQNMFLWLLYFM